MFDTVVIGAGLSGLVAAIKLAREGQRVALLTKGLGGLQLSQGSIDLLGYNPDRVDRPLDAIGPYATAHPDHPYAVIGADAVARGVSYLKDLLDDLLVGDPSQNMVLPTAVGALRPTSIAPRSMAGGAVTDGIRYLIAGFRQLKDFYPGLCAANLARQRGPHGEEISARPVLLDFPARDGMADSSALAYARALDDPEVRAKLAVALRAVLQEGEVVGLPAVLGIKDPGVHRHLESALMETVFEIPLPPPSVPGMRINEALTQRAKRAGVRIILGSPVVTFAHRDGRLTSVSIDAAGGHRVFKANSFVYAPGGFESGTISMDSYGTLTERVFHLPLRNLGPGLVDGDSWSDQELFRVGVGVDQSMRVLDAGGRPVYANLFAAGGLIAGALRWSEKSGEGIALGSAVRACESILEGAK